MYGVGYNFTPQFAYCTKNIVGSLPVGMDSMRGDDPYWHGSAYATSKEMWIAPVNRFMGTVATYMEKEVGDAGAVFLAFENDEREGETFSAVLILKGTGTHKIGLRLFNAESDFVPQTVTLAEGEELRMNVTLTVSDASRPFVAVAFADDDTALSAEFSGACI